MRRRLCTGARRLAVMLVAGLLASAAVPAAARDSWVLIVCGASGGEKYAEQMRTWRGDLQNALVSRFGFAPERVRVLVDETDTTGEQATAEALRKTLGEIRKEMGADDLLVVMLFGHGTYDGETAKFNLVGPDITAAEWARLFAGIPGRLTVVNTTESSYPFLAALSARGRVIITATDSTEQRFATVFPEYFVQAVREASTDTDKNGRTSIYEVFATASAAVRQHFEQRGMLTTERAVLDDNGDKLGREDQVAGPDGALAKTLSLEAQTPLDTDDPKLAELLRERRALEVQAEDLKARKPEMAPEEWDAAFEKLMVDLARISRAIRNYKS